MKVYIATFSKYENYGSRLQNFALCRTIKKFNAEPITLIVETKKDLLLKIVKNFFAIMPAFTYKQRVWLCEKRKSNKFISFNKKLNFFYVNYNVLKDIDFANAIAIAGSDQIWSPVHLLKHSNDMELFFLRFVPKNKRFAYAPSFGVSSIPLDMVDKYRKYIMEFNEISVREDIGQKLIENMTGKKAVILSDPTVLLSKNEWIEETKDIKNIKFNKKYVLIYFLSEPQKENFSRIKEYAKSRQLEIISVVGNIYKNENIVPSPDEFVNLINNAEVVFTDSFHGCVFSIIMETPFIVFRRTDVEQFSRIETLLRKYCLYEMAKNIINNNVDIEKILRTQDFNLAKKIMIVERQKGLSFLRNIIKT